MRELDAIPEAEIDFRPDPYLRSRCGICGVIWAEHPEGLNCSRYRPEAPPESLPGATVANTPGACDKGRSSMRRYPHEVCPPLHLRAPRVAPVGPEATPALPVDPEAERALIAQDKAAGLIPGDWLSTDPMRELKGGDR